ncbi:hypothetical protein RclHR1_01180015 [Rhizophagus clarus]|nr:hypothetical protein RclHR1_01180015 [Rhizophagus clarus]
MDAQQTSTSNMDVDAQSTSDSNMDMSMDISTSTSNMDSHMVVQLEAQKTQKRTSEKMEEPFPGKTTAGSSADHTTTPTLTIYPKRKRVKVNEPDNQLETFKAIVQQATETDKKIISVINQHPVVYLPKLGPNKLQDRFKFSNEKLSFIRRKNHHRQITKTFIEMTRAEKNSKCLYIRGPSGLGKSYSLYYLVSELRLQPDYRVTYINSCEEWWISHQIEPYQYLINELLCTFHKDVLSPLTITDWAELVMYGLTTNIRENLNAVNENQHNFKLNEFNEVNTSKGRFQLFINVLADFVKNDFYWVWIFDQCDALHEHKVLDEYPFTLVNDLPGILGNAGLIIVSETSNNEVCHFKSWNKLHLFDGYDDDEFNQWCILHGYVNEGQLNYVKYWTGASPLELDMWHNTSAEDLQKKTENYLIKKECDIAKDYKIYQEGLTKIRRENLNQCVISMILQTDSPANRYGMNRQFMHVSVASFQGANEEIKTIVANCPFIRITIIHIHGKEIIKDLRETTSVILQDNKFTNKIKERITSSYITTILDIVRKFNFRCWKFGKPSLEVFDKSIVFDKAFRLIDNDVPSYSMYDFKVHQNVLFIPESPNYPGVDFLIWNFEDKILFAFQIAISKLNDRKNADNFTKGRNSPSLKNKWANLFEIDESNVYFIWIVPDSIVDKDTNSLFGKLHASIVSFSNIEDQFPALADLRTKK